MKVLVTGYRGFIGRHLDFDDMVGFDIRDGFEYDITNPYSVETFWSENKPDIVVHLAANPKPYISEKYPWWDAQLNITGLLNVLQASLRNSVKFFIFPSTCQVYHVANLPMHEESPVNPKSAYAISKYTGELYCKNYMRRGLNTCILRFFNVYGPGQEGYVIPDIIEKVMSGDRVEVSGPPDDSRDFVYVDDVADAIEKAVENRVETAGRVINIGSGSETNVGDLCEIIAKVLGKKVQFTYKEGRPIGRFPGRYCADISKAAALLGWYPTTELEDGIRLTTSRVKT